jgi:tetratricopeptide (TPR) repeat protein
MTLKGGKAQAVEDATHYIALRPEEPWGYSVRGPIYVALGDYRRAIADFTHIIDTDTGVQAVAAYCTRGVAYEMEGQKDLAKRDFDQAERRAPGRTHRVVEEDRQYVLRLRTLAKARGR